MKVLVAGLGGAGQRLLRLLKAKQPELEVIAYRVKKRKAVITPGFQLDETQDVEKAFGIRSFDELQSALGQKPDYAIIANPTSEHVKTALQVARASCHLFIEKPLSHNLEGVQELLAEVKRSKLVCFVGYQMRFHPALRAMKAVLEAGELGKPKSAKIAVRSFLPGWHPYEDYRALYAAQKRLGGGVVLTESHEIDYAYWFFGMPDKVFAKAENRLGLEVEDTAFLQLDYGRELSVEIEMSFADENVGRSCEIECENGSVSWDAGENELVLAWAGGRTELRSFPEFKREDMFSQELDSFLESVKNGKPAEISLEDGVASLRIALAAKKSIETGESEVV